MDPLLQTSTSTPFCRGEGPPPTPALRPQFYRPSSQSNLSFFRHSQGMISCPRFHPSDSIIKIIQGNCTFPNHHANFTFLNHHANCIFLNHHANSICRTFQKLLSMQFLLLPKQ